ncbi:MAG TPA: HTH domain-containing protein [Polyangia bacterium]|nr:HTH domain-containing protein [Polyangia bacterium]
MTFLEAAFEVLRWEGRPLHYKELTERALGKKLLTFVGRTPEVTMQTQLTAAVKKAPGSPFVRVKPGVFGLLRYPEIPAEERAAAAAKAEEATARPRAADGEAAAPGEGGRRRRRRGSGRGREEPQERRGASPGAGTARPEAGATGAPDEGEDGEIQEPEHGGLSAEARAAALAATGVLEADDENAGDEEVPRAMDSMEDEAGPGAAPLEASEGPSDEEMEAEGEGAPEGDQDEGDDEGEGGEPGGEELDAAGEGQRAAEPEQGMGGRRRRRRRRRGGRGGELEPFGEGPRMTEGLAPAGGSSSGAPGLPPGLEAGAFGGEPSSPPPAPADGAGGSAAPSGDNGQGPRRIMTPVDAAIEILRGQAPGRGVHVRQIADGASRRRLVHGEPNEAWRVMRTALAAEPRERLRAGQRPRLRSAGAGLFALARRPPEAELERAEQVFGEARRALRERTLASLERRLAELPAPAFEALARVLLQREGFGPATFVKRVEGTVYVEALRGRGGRPSRCLIGFRFGGATAARGSILELRYGIRARGQDEGLLMLAGRLSEEAIAAWKQPGPPIEIADGAAMAETCVRHGVGVINTMVSVDFVDADFFAEIAEG